MYVKGHYTQCVLPTIVFTELDYSISICREER